MNNREKVLICTPSQLLYVIIQRGDPDNCFWHYKSFVNARNEINSVRVAVVNDMCENLDILSFKAYDNYGA